MPLILIGRDKQRWSY